jgi:hypothetical protein
MAIERANKVLFDATDDVKALHSKLLLSEVRHIQSQRLWLTRPGSMLQHSRSGKWRCRDWGCARSCRALPGKMVY